MTLLWVSVWVLSVSMIPKAMPAETSIPGRLNHTRLVLGERLGKGQSLVPLVGGKVCGKSPALVKTLINYRNLIEITTTTTIVIIFFLSGSKIMANIATVLQTEWTWTRPR